MADLTDAELAMLDAPIGQEEHRAKASAAPTSSSGLTAAEEAMLTAPHGQEEAAMQTASYAGRPRSLTEALHHPLDTLGGPFLDLIPGVSTLRTPLVSAANALRGAVEPSLIGAARQTEGTVAGAAKRAGGLAGLFATELVGGVLEAAPEQFAVLPALGAAMRAGSAVDRLMAGVREIPGVKTIEAAVSHRGGMSAGAKAGFEALDTATMKGRIVGGELGEKMEAAGPMPEQIFTRILAQQPEMREQMRYLNAQEYPVSREELLQFQRPVPGFKEPLTMADLPETLSKAPTTYADVAQDLAGAFHQRLEKIAALGEKDPSQISRMTEFDYFPFMVAGDRIGAFPTTPKLLRERAGFLKHRTDLTTAEREMLGRATPAAEVALGIMKQDRLIATRELFNTLAADTEASRVATAEEGAWSAGRATLDGKWIKLPTDEKLGPLSGRMVEPAVYREVNDFLVRPGRFGEFWRTNMSTWGFGKTVLNPATHVNNFVSNIIQAAFAGLPEWRLDIYVRAAKEMLFGGAYWKELEGGGAQWAVKGPGSRLYNEVVDLNRAQRVGAQNMFEVLAATLNDVVTNNRVSRKLADFYQGAESFFKTAVYIAQRKKGAGIAEAMNIANNALIDYSKVPRYVKQLRGTMLPFVTFTWKIPPILARAAIERPSVYARYMLYANAWNRAARYTADISDAEWQDIMKAFPGGIPMLAPFRSANGTPMIYDFARKTPMADFMGGVSGDDLGALPGRVVLKNPVISEAIAQLMGQDPRTGIKFAEPMGFGGQARQAGDLLGASGPGLDEALKIIGAGSARGAHAARQFLPEILGGGATQNVLSALRGDRNYLGEQVSVPRALVEALLGKGRSLLSAKAGAAMALKQVPGAAKAAAYRMARKGGGMEALRALLEEAP